MDLPIFGGFEGVSTCRKIVNQVDEWIFDFLYRLPSNMKENTYMKTSNIVHRQVYQQIPQTIKHKSLNIYKKYKLRVNPKSRKPDSFNRRKLHIPVQDHVHIPSILCCASSYLPN